MKSQMLTCDLLPGPGEIKTPFRCILQLLETLKELDMSLGQAHAVRQRHQEGNGQLHCILH